MIVSAIFFSFAAANAKTASECHRELKKLCQDKTSGLGKFECMKANKEKLDAECQKVIAEKKEQFGSAKDACKIDREKCKKDIKPGKGGIIHCLLEKRAELADSCKNWLEDHMESKPCFEDRMKHCKDVEPGKGRIHACLKGKLGELSAKCKTAVESGKKGDLDAHEE